MENLKVLVALHDDASVESLIKLACQRAHGTGADLIALYVVETDPEVSLGTPSEDLERSAKDIFSRAEQVAYTFCTPISTRLIEARGAGEAIVAQATNQAVDLIVMGYHHKHGLGEMLLGSTVRYVAEHAPCRVIIQVPPVEVRQKVAAIYYELASKSQLPFELLRD
jgi:nucleotide-binding universal stress UspA family protein